ncbi:MAG: hypothetical protein IIA14_02975 [SAR324 cluster bacterium]|nr:hypothetical protein [SAR324 cluster bacterium]
MFRLAAITVIAAIIAGAMTLAAFSGAGSGAQAAEPVFVRGGLVLPEAAAGAGSYRVNGREAAVVPVPAGGVLLEYPWRPRENVSLSWKEAGQERSLALRAPLRPTPQLWFRVAWPGRGVFSTEPPRPLSALAFSAKGEFLAAGSEGGEARVFRVATGEQVWQLHRPGRVIKHLAFSGDGRRLYVGEQGPEGRLAAYDFRGGTSDPLWRFDTARELGETPPANPADPYWWVPFPGAYRLEERDGDLLAAYSHSWVRNGRRIARARLYRLEGASGRLRWAYPASGPAEKLITWFTTDAAGARVGLPLQLPLGAEPGVDGSSRLVLLDGASGAVAFDRAIPPVPPYAIATFWRGVAFAPDGEKLALSTQDGRSFLFRKTKAGWEEVRRLELAATLKLAGTVITATNGTLAATAAEALFVTGPAYVPDPFRAEGAQPRLTHPQGNTLFAFGWEGEPHWRWRLDNDLQGLALAERVGILALAQGREGPQPPGDFNGVALLKLPIRGEGRGQLLYRFPLAGRAVYGGVAVSDDGKWIAVAEAPRTVRGDARPRGAHAITVLR